MTQSDGTLLLDEASDREDRRLRRRLAAPRVEGLHVDAVVEHAQVELVTVAVLHDEVLVRFADRDGEVARAQQGREPVAGHAFAVDVLGVAGDAERDAREGVGGAGHVGGDGREVGVHC